MEPATGIQGPEWGRGTVPPWLAQLSCPGARFAARPSQHIGSSASGTPLFSGSAWLLCPVQSCPHPQWTPVCKHGLRGPPSLPTSDTVAVGWLRPAWGCSGRRVQLHTVRPAGSAGVWEKGDVQMDGRTDGQHLRAQSAGAVGAEPTQKRQPKPAPCWHPRVKNGLTRTTGEISVCVRLHVCAPGVCVPICVWRGEAEGRGRRGT